MILVGTKAPDFNLKDQNNEIHNLTEYKGKWIVIYFYPKDFSPRSITQAKNFNDNITKFKDFNTEILGISPDFPLKHKKFVDEYNLSLTILSDPEKNIIKSYQANGIITKRISYLIDPEGIIKKTYVLVDPGRHAEEILNDLIDLRDK